VSDELRLPPPHEPRVDSLAAIGKAVQGSSRAQRLVPWLLGMLGVIGSWIAAKIDTRLDIQHEVRVQVAEWQVAQVGLQAQQHAEVLRKFDSLEDRLFSQDMREPGKVKQIETDVWWAFQGLSKLHAMTLAGEASKARAAKEAEGARFVRSFDPRARDHGARAAYLELVDHVAVP
jgi:hypothetical protein